MSCPAGKHLLGTGARINNGNNQVVLDDLRPDASLKKVTVTGYEDSDGYDSDWTRHRVRDLRELLTPG